MNKPEIFVEYLSKHLNVLKIFGWDTWPSEMKQAYFNNIIEAWNKSFQMKNYRPKVNKQGLSYREPSEANNISSGRMMNWNLILIQRI